MAHFPLILLITLSFLKPFGGAVLDCRDPPAESETFFDLEELQSLGNNYPDIFQTPVECTTENEASKCANQICCGEEIGCCFYDTENNRQICGCKAKTDKTCTRGPPVAFIHTYRCESPSSAESYTCIQKYKEGEVVEGSVTTSIGPVSRGLLEHLLADAQSIGEITTEVWSLDTVSLISDDVDSNLPDDDLNNLIDSLTTAKLYSLAIEVMERHKKGLPYGRQHQN